MRLINVYSMEMREFVSNIPRYAILSHRWSEDEISLKDYGKNRRLGSIGYRKVKQLCDFVRTSELDGTLLPQNATLETKEARLPLPVDWVWIDTVCIDTKSSAELSEAINSMYDWYWNASVCVAYLSDVPARDPLKHPSTKFTWMPEYLASSQWFNRGWTLQELLAPRVVVFVNAAWEEIGRKDEAMALRNSNVLNQDFLDTIARITNIPRVYIGLRDSISRACFAEKMSWASRRSTSRPEDMAYCLLGLLNVNLPLLYGEGIEKAFLRLQQQFIQQSDDESIFAWNDFSSGMARPLGILASSPSNFRGSGHLRDILPAEEEYTLRPPFAITNKGLSFETSAYKLHRKDYTADSEQRKQAVPRIIIDREMPPGPVYAVQLNCKTTRSTLQHNATVLCHLKGRGALRAPRGQFSRIAYLGHTCFIFLREHETERAVGETSTYFEDPDSSFVLGFVGDQERLPKRLFVKLQSAASRVTASELAEQISKEPKVKMAFDSFMKEIENSDT